MSLAVASLQSVSAFVCLLCLDALVLCLAGLGGHTEEYKPLAALPWDRLKWSVMCMPDPAIRRRGDGQSQQVYL
jgi:hypothetical protein